MSTTSDAGLGGVSCGDESALASVASSIAFCARTTSLRAKHPAARPICATRGILAAFFTLLAIVTVTLLPPAARAGELRHGVNLSHWFEQEGRAPVSADDFAALRKAGFDHVRIPVNPLRIGWNPAQQSSLLTLAPLMDAVRTAVDAGLDVIVDVSPDERTRARIEDDSDTLASYTRALQTIAQPLARFPTGRVFFEPLNEPQFYGFRGASRWQQMQGDLIARIRPVAPNLTLIVTGRRGGDLDGLEELEPYSDRNLVYTFHYYLPYIFTHQGASWMRDDPGTTAGLFSHVLYPSRLVRDTPPLERASSPDASQRMNVELASYENADWNAAHIAAYLRPALDLARQRGIRIVCTEFGVLRDGVDAASRDRWLHDVRATLDSMQIGWTVWDYSDAFGITLADGSEPGSRRLDPVVLDALGLHGDRP